ncbi:MAG: Stp1/IreP family PP2C-type Ser/Thr phosphatase [Selenomonadaceae bacterium]|nr:Stp1/IreP family PP2C-type Ser/Thr phosphatase [Selenomonadaceae bacterium]
MCEVKILTKYEQATNVGLVRKQNEDSIAVIEPDTFIVADGMGGQAAGEIASRMLIETVKNELNSIPLPWNEETLSAAISKANEKILSEAKIHSEYEGMGTTATILHIAQPKETQPQIITQRAFYAHVGDSRLYKLEHDYLKQITRDHSYVEDLVLKGEITEEEARSHPMRNVLTQAVGAMPDINIDVGSFKVNRGEVYLLCTDGLTNMVDDREIFNILHSTKNPADDLIETALNHGGKDNVSVIVVGIL